MRVQSIIVPGREGALFLTLLIMLANMSCTLLPPGNEQQVTEARLRLEQNDQAIKERLSELTQLLNQYTAHPGAKLLISQITWTDPPPVTFTQAQISPHYGVFDEISPGVFEFREARVGYIGLNYLDGTSVIFNIGFDYYSAGHHGFSLTIKSSTPVPQEDSINIWMNYSWGNTLLMTGSGTANSGFPAGTDRIHISAGYQHTPVSAAPKDYTITYNSGWVSYGEACDIGIKPLTQYQFTSICKVPDYEKSFGNLVRGRSIYVSDQTKQYYGTRLNEQATLYSPTDQPGVWLARQTGKRATGGDPNNGGLVVYDVKTQITAPTPTTLQAVKYWGDGIVTIGYHKPFQSIPYRVALPKGGPYTCELGNPASITGTGTPVTLQWNDGQNDVLFPSPTLDCAAMIWQF